MDRGVAHIVVPEGMRRRGEGGIAPAFQACVRRVAERAERSARIFIAPGNAFGHPQPEDVVAADLLGSLRPDLRIHLAAPSRERHLDTLDNAVCLREWAERQGEWPLGPVWLYCTRLHLWRSRWCFQFAGFEIERTLTSEPSEVAPLPLRLVYYGYPVAHVVYEAAALLFASVRMLARSIRGTSRLAPARGQQ